MKDRFYRPPNCGVNHRRLTGQPSSDSVPFRGISWHVPVVNGGLEEWRAAGQVTACADFGVTCVPDFCMGAAVSRPGDNSLSGRFRAGDESVLREVWEWYGPALARRLLGRFRGLIEPCDAEELVNVALDHAWQSRESYDPSKPLVAWLWRVVYTTGLSQLRCRDPRHARETITPASVLELLCGRPPGGDPDLPTRHRCGISSEELWAAVYRLPPNWQAIVRAHARAPNGHANNGYLQRSWG